MFKKKEKSKSNEGKIDQIIRIIMMLKNQVENIKNLEKQNNNNVHTNDIQEEISKFNKNVNNTYIALGNIFNSYSNDKKKNLFLKVLNPLKDIKLSVPAISLLNLRIQTFNQIIIYLKEIDLEKVA